MEEGGLTSGMGGAGTGDPNPGGDDRLRCCPRAWIIFLNMAAVLLRLLPLLNLVWSAVGCRCGLEE